MCASDDEDRQGALQDVPGRGDGRGEAHQDRENGDVLKHNCRTRAEYEDGGGGGYTRGTKHLENLCYYFPPTLSVFFL